MFVVWYSPTMGIEENNLFTNSNMKTEPRLMCLSPIDPMLLEGNTTDGRKGKK